MARALVVGYGSSLRGDDALGLRLVQALRTRVDPEVVELMELHQLTPELAETISQFELVIFVDASISGVAGELRSRRILPKRGPQTESHVMDVSALLNLAATLFNHAPKAFIVTITGEEFDLSTELSTTVSSVLPSAVSHVEELIATHLGG